MRSYPFPDQCLPVHPGDILLPELLSQRSASEATPSSPDDTVMVTPMLATYPVCCKAVVEVVVVVAVVAAAVVMTKRIADSGGINMFYMHVSFCFKMTHAE